MASDTLLEERMYPCNNMPVEKLDERIRRICGGYGRTDIDLRDCIYEIIPQDIYWEKIRYLRFIGSGDKEVMERFDACGISRSLYLNSIGNWLLVVLPENVSPDDYLPYCEKYLESMGLWNMQISSQYWRNLQVLRELDLWNIQLTADTGPIEFPLALELLSLTKCTGLVKIHNLDQLSRLKELFIAECISLTDLAGLEALLQLTKLYLIKCRRITMLPGLENLKQLTRLNLLHCYNLAVLPALEDLPQLTELDVSNCPNLAILPKLSNLPRLTKVNLAECSYLRAFPELKELPQMTELNLSWCTRPKTLPKGLRYCKNLRFLNLSYMHLEDLPDWLPEISESFTTEIKPCSGQNKAAVCLWDTTVDAIPDMSIFEQPYTMVAKWFSDKNKVPLNEIKVVFLGDGEAGKSYTIARLMNDGGDPVDYVDQPTPGIFIKRRRHTVKERNFQVNYWDFGGQEIMHSMHRIFLTGRTMYVILLNARDDTQSDRAKYWLHNVSSFAPDAPVLLVLNKIDQNPNASVDERDLHSRYDKLTQIVRLSAKDFSRDEFNSAFTDVLLKEIEKTGFLDFQWPISWTKVKEKLENMESHYIMGDTYEEICQECSVDQDREDLLRWFNDLGVSFCCRDTGDFDLKDYVILSPDWITNALYIILFNRLMGARNGLIPRSSIFEILGSARNNPSIRCTMPDARYYSGDIQFVLGVMHKFNLSFSDNRGNEFIPMLCQQNSKVNIETYYENPDILEFIMEFDYLPNNLLHHLMVERSSELDIATVWRTGARFQHKELGYSAMVVIDGNYLRFFIWHSNPMHRPNTYLMMLTSDVDRIVSKMGLKAPSVQLIYKLDGKRDEFDFEELKMLLEVGQNQTLSKAGRKMIPIVDILNQSAPDGQDDEKKLLEKIIQACGNIQDEPSYRLVPKSDGQGYVNGKGMEDLRNRRVRDNLINSGYRVSDQSQRGSSGTGKSIGELDMLVYNDSNEPWTIIEALRVSDKDKSKWNEHLERLSDKYNTRGFPALYLLTYVDADTTAFAQIWKSYQDHIKTYHPGQLKYADGSFVEMDVPNHQYVKVAKCRYSGGVDPITVYHIFACIPI